MSSAHTRAELHRHLLAALDVTLGHSYEIIDGPPNARSLAISTLISLKRELLDDYPAIADLQIKPIPYTKNGIAIFNLPSTPNGEDF